MSDFPPQLKFDNTYQVHIIDIQDEIERIPLEFWMAEIPIWNGPAMRGVDFVGPDWFITFLRTSKEEYREKIDIDMPPVEVHEHLRNINWVWINLFIKIHAQDEAVFYRIPLPNGKYQWFMYFPHAIKINNLLSNKFKFIGTYTAPTISEIENDKGLSAISRYTDKVNCSVLMKTWNSRRNYVRNQERHFFEQRKDIVRTKALMNLGPLFNDIRDQTEEILSLIQNGNLEQKQLENYLTKVIFFTCKVTPYGSKLK